jgi:hypothetical protein
VAPFGLAACALTMAAACALGYRTSKARAG